MLAELRSARADGDAERFRRAAHSLKSNATPSARCGSARMARELELAGPDAARRRRAPLARWRRNTRASRRA